MIVMRQCYSSLLRNASPYGESYVPVKKRPPKNMPLFCALAVITAPILCYQIINQESKHIYPRSLFLSERSIVKWTYTRTAFPKNMENRRPNLSGKYAIGQSSDMNRILALRKGLTSRNRTTVHGILAYS